MNRTPDFLIIGGGIVGLTVALELKRRWPDQSVLLIEKEPALGQHASGRNSGVLHAGFYYSADSLKAKFCRDGNRELSGFCAQRSLPINKCGKLVVARNESELQGLDELLRRGRANLVDVDLISAHEARLIEPRVKTHEQALWSPTTASVDPSEVMRALEGDATGIGVQIAKEVAYGGTAARRDGGTTPRTAHRAPHRAIQTSSGSIDAGYVVNCAGLYADHIARDFGFAERYRILPFKGLYLHGDETERLAVHVYPVPDLENPFLGVHFTVTVDGGVTIGPTAIPAFWREHYTGLPNFRAGEMLEVLWREAGLFLRNRFGFRGMALREMRKHSRQHLVGLAGDLVSDVTVDRYRDWGRPGIRAQLLDLDRGRLEMDFVVEGDDRSLHVLNAVSPAFTCAMPFSRYVVNKVENAVRGARSAEE